MTEATRGDLHAIIHASIHTFSQRFINKLQFGFRICRQFNNYNYSHSLVVSIVHIFITLQLVHYNLKTFCLLVFIIVS